MEGLNGYNGESNWDRLEAEESQGLLVTLLNMDSDQLGVLADILDAQAIVREKALPKESVERCKGQRLVEGDKLSSDRITPKSDYASLVFSSPKEIVCTSTCLPKSTLNFSSLPGPQVSRGDSLHGFSGTAESPILIEVAAMKPDENKTYYGAHATINVQALDVKDNQYSTAQIWIGGGPKDQQVSLEAGWMVSPQVSKDKLTRVYIYWMAPNSKSGCYNFLCPGFVQVSSKAAPGSHILGTSVYGGTQFVINLIISQDKATGNWWVIVQGIHLGYWPKSLIPQLEGGASMVAWGGVAAGPPNGESPPMGNGHYPQDDDYTKACFIQNLQTIDASNRYVVPDENKIPTYLDNRECYGLLYSGYRKERGISFLFGGPGGKCGV